MWLAIVTSSLVTIVGAKSKELVQFLSQAIILLENVLLVDSLKFNLLAVTQLCDFGYKCSFTKDDIVVTSLDGKDHIFTGFRHEDVYLVDFATKEANFLLVCSLNHLWVGYGIEDLIMLA